MAIDTSFTRSLDDLVESLRSVKARSLAHGRGCTLLIGAGCSVDAGIPTANGFVECIKDRHPRSHDRAVHKTYPACMGQLTFGERRDLIAEFVDGAKINWTHICIALLMQAGYVDRVLTTNFDPLIIRACALLSEFPAVYDFAASQYFRAADIPDKAVFYLHGQRTGFVLLNLKEEVERHSERLGPVFDDAGRGRMWIVVGYSGENDPVFNHLARVDRFDNSLYWVGYQTEGPPAHVSERLLTPQKDAFFVPGFDANSFFITLTQKLKLFPPTLIARPFSHLRGVIQSLTPYRLPGQSSEDDVTRPALGWIQEAVARYEAHDTEDSAERPSPDPVVAATSLLMKGEYDRVVALRPELDRNPSPELADAVSWAYVMLGSRLSDRALKAEGQELDRLFQLASEEFIAALAIKPDKHEALNNWGLALAGQASTKTGDQADQLFQLAGEKYDAALVIKSDMHDALNNWGIALADQARTKTGEEADRLFQLASEKLATALAIKPDLHDVLFNWGNALSHQARTKIGEEADRLFQLAGEKYAAALAIKSDMLEALNSWSGALVSQAALKSGAERTQLLQLAGEKAQAAEVLRPGFAAYNIACAKALVGDELGCRRCLEASREAGRLPKREHLEVDPDLESVRKCDWFQELLADQ